MEQPSYYPTAKMLGMLDEPNRSACRKLYHENLDRLLSARGSTHNHQSWYGGYHDHVEDAMNYAILFYRADTLTGRPMPFTLSDALLAVFLHDIEKPWRFERDEEGHWVNSGLMKDKEDRADFRWKKISEYGIVITPVIVNAITYAEGEGDDYRSDRRVSNELAGFVHVCDVYSARVRHDYPRELDQWARVARNA